MSGWQLFGLWRDILNAHCEFLLNLQAFVYLWDDQEKVGGFLMKYLVPFATHIYPQYLPAEFPCFDAWVCLMCRYDYVTAFYLLDELNHRPSFASLLRVRFLSFSFPLLSSLSLSLSSPLKHNLSTAPQAILAGKTFLDS